MTPGIANSIVLESDVKLGWEKRYSANKGANEGEGRFSWFPLLGEL